MLFCLHGIAGNIIKGIKISGVESLCDGALGGLQNIPLFCSKKKSSGTRFCLVDGAILKDEKVKVIIEVEESSITPTQLAGKLLASAASKYYIHESHGNNPIEMADDVVFIHLIDERLISNGNSGKYEQFSLLSERFNEMLPFDGSNISRYSLFIGSRIDFESGSKGQLLLEELLKILK